jgi:DNA (cytosine-5)-methyltransferase 1
MTLLPERILSGEVEAPDVFCGGTPCQAFSVAGLRNSLDDARGNLSLTFVGIANAIDHVRSIRRDDPAIIFWENVPGVLSTKDNAFGCFLGALAGEDDPIIPPGEKWTNAGCVYGPQRTVAWRVLDAQYFGVAQRRRRVFVVASARDDFDPASVLFEFDGVRRDTAPSREAGQSIAPCVTNGPLFSRTGNERVEAEAMVVQKKQWPADIASTLDTTFGTKQGLEDQHVNAGCPLFVPASTVQTLRCRRPGEGGMSGDDEHLIPVISPALNTCSGSHHAPDTKAYVVQPIAFHPTQDPISSTNGTTHGLGCGSSGGQASVAIAQPIPFDTTQITSPANYSKPQAGDPCHPLAAGAHAPAVIQTMQVRRLTPVECERLQGFPDNYTNIPWRKKDESPDGPRYKALGNSWAVPVVRWIGRRIQEQINAA